MILSSTLTNIGEYSFSGTAIETIDIPGSVEVISAYAFADCKSLSTVICRPGLTVISESAFSGCDNLASLTVPATLKEVNDDAFKGCDSLKDVYYGGSAQSWANANKHNNASILNAAELHPNTPAPDPTKPDEPSSDGAGLKLGDLDGDGQILAKDARIALRISAKLEKPADELLKAADVNKDNEITASDARLILRVSAKLQTEF